MRAVKGAQRLQMRFSVLSLAADPEAAWERVQAPNLDQWVTALAGKQRYVYTKHVEGLQPGVGYRVSVRFRWRDADGEVLRSVTRRSRVCQVPDPRPNLVPVAIEGVPDGYTLTVANKGRTAAPATFASFEAGDAALPDEEVPELAPGARFKVTFAGPACAPAEMLAATVDATGLVDEAVEADDVLTVPCPASGDPYTP
jgi:CARDB